MAVALWERRRVVNVQIMGDDVTIHVTYVALATALATYNNDQEVKK